ncbi:MAG TPA: DUF3108 domain-containing protein [Bryobacteraceae bacterium]|nr:DUF3108 domain-containing protein [Bryobacteraceae bacterium]
MKRIPLAVLLFSAAAAAQTGFPFTDETLHYSINWPSGLSLGDATFTAHKTASGWSFDATADAGVPGFSISDKFHSSATAVPCSLELTRDLSHGKKKTREKTTFDQEKGSAHRVTTLPQDGGVTDLTTHTCARDALAFVYFARREMGQGRVAPAEQVYLGAAYSVRLEYTGAMTITADGKPAVTDHVNASVKGPQSNVTFEIFFARDAARTPLLVRVPLALGTISVELVR